MNVGYLLTTLGTYEKNWDFVIDDMVQMIINPSIANNKKLYSTMKKIREQFYILFIKINSINTNKSIKIINIILYVKFNMD